MTSDRRNAQRRYETEIRATLRNVRDLETLIADYEATGGHDHGRGPIVNRACPGGDCLVHEARLLLAKVTGKSAALSGLGAPLDTGGGTYWIIQLNGKWAMFESHDGDFGWDTYDFAEQQHKATTFVTREAADRAAVQIKRQLAWSKNTLVICTTNAAATPVHTVAWDGSMAAADAAARTKTP